MKNVLLLLFFSFFCFTSSFCQKWNKVENSSFRSSDEQRLLLPSKYESYELDFDQLKTILKDAPKRFESREKGVIINWPMPNDKNQKFTVKRSDVFHPDLAAKYPKIKAYTGHSLTDPTAILKISISHKGIEGMLLSNRHKTLYLDRYQPKSKEKYILYNRDDYLRVLPPGEGTCTVEDPKDGYKATDHSQRFGDCQLRKYRLAMACTGEYASFHGGNIPDVLAEFNASMVRINGIYERDFTVTMELISNTDELIFLNSSTDPYTNNDGPAMLDQNQSTIDQIIGFNNYDIGHVYSTGGGGIASLRSPCTNRKARGVTGLGNPTGDPFWVDYVAHEMGHQFGGNHTQNNSCNRNNSTAAEPGSASTIMGYAGICNPNVQNNSDDYFHSVSQVEAANFVVAGAGDCAEIIPLDNNAPEIESLTQTGQVLPSRTPFFLTAEATDQDSDMLTYCWEQIDTEVATMPPVSSAIGGPAFRSFDPTENPTRYFPGLPSILAGINGTTWEVLPSSNRDMNFNLTVRDNFPMGGCTADEELSISFTSSAGPFTISSQNSFTSWNSGETETVTWNVANTDAAPVSCGNVDIILSLDRGKSFDIILAENVPNDGEQDIIVPFEVTTQGRIMVKCSSKTFFDLNNRDINIISPFSMEVAPSSITLCPTEVATYMIDHTFFSTNPTPVTYSLNGLPTGATYTFSPAEVIEDTEIILTLDNLTSDLAGSYDLEIVAQGEMATISETVTLFLGTDENIPINYLSPEDGQIGVSVAPVLSWEELNGVDMYEVEIAENPNFIDVTFAASTVDNFTLPTGLNSMTVYYWRVRGISSCVEPLWQNIQSFQTRGLTCITATEDANMIISQGEATVIESEIEIMSGGVYGDLLINVQIDHTWVGDLSAKLKAPDGTEVVLFQRPGVPESNYGCGENNIVCTFSPSAVNSAEDFENSCNDTGNAIEGTFQPLESFSAFENLPMDGMWTLTIEDSFAGDGGELLSWSIENCVTSFIESGVILKNIVLPLTNSTAELVTMSYLEMENNDPVNTWITLRSIPIHGEIQRFNSSLGDFESLEVGDLFTQQEVNQDMIRYMLSDLTATEDSFVFDTEDDQSRYTSNNTFLISVSISALSISASITDQISCFGETDGRIEVMGEGGLPDYTYSINEGPFESQNIFENLGAGDYTIIVKDDVGTEVSSDVLTIIEPSQITFVFFLGDNEITIGGEGGTGALMYSLDGINYTAESTIEIFDGTTYRIYVKDENGCVAQSFNELTFYQIEGVEIFSMDVDCKGAETGTITIDNIQGGLAPYTYQLDEETPINENSFLNLGAATYTIKIKDASGVSLTIMDIIINEPEFALEAISSVTEAFVTISGNGGTEEYLYSITGSDFIEDGDFGPLPDGDYIGYVVDSNGCTDTTSFTILASSTINIELENLQLVPNPVESNFTLDSKDNISFEYHIYDYTGKSIVKNRSTSNSAISAEILNPGLYFISVKHKDATRVFILTKI